MKKIIYLLLVLIVLSSIFFFSSKTSTESNGTSKKLIKGTISVIEKITHKEFDKKRLVNKLNYPVRKLAHFTIFFLLGLSLFLFINTFNIDNKILISIIACFLCAILDETHQMFSLGRSPLLLDVCIDTIGAFVGIILIKY